MQQILIFLGLFLVIVVTDLIPLFREKEWNYLFFTVPAYVVCLAMNLPPAFGVQYTSVFALIIRAMSKFIK